MRTQQLTFVSWSSSHCNAAFISKITQDKLDHPHISQLEPLQSIMHSAPKQARPLTDRKLEQVKKNIHCSNVSDNLTMTPWYEIRVINLNCCVVVSLSVRLLCLNANTLCWPACDVMPEPEWRSESVMTTWLINAVPCIIAHFKHSFYSFSTFLWQIN